MQERDAEKEIKRTLQSLQEYRKTSEVDHLWVAVCRMSALTVSMKHIADWLIVNTTFLDLAEEFYEIVVDVEKHKLLSSCLEEMKLNLKQQIRDRDRAAAERRREDNRAWEQHKKDPW